MRRTLFATAIGLAAALLFLVQPMVARFLLPVVGGSTVVWSTALVFFQASLLVGYLIAHVLRIIPGGRFVYAGLLIVAGLIALPFAVPEATPDWASPSTWLLGQLTIMVAAPFVLLSAASPLLQHWYSRGDEPDAAQPYRLYAASNAGSILGLLSYPFVIEPLSQLSQQAVGWATGFALCVVLIAVAAAKTPARAEPAASDAEDGPDTMAALWWIVCAAIPASLLVTMTANITSDVAPVPLLWVVPLVAYLASHVWVFSRRAPDAERVVHVLLAAVLPYAAISVFDLAKPWWFFAPLHVAMLGLIAVAYHGELARTRPAPAHLTTFYLWTALGGALGGVFATLVAPLLFDTLLELELLLVAAALLLPFARNVSTSWKRVGISVVVGLLICAPALMGGYTPEELLPCVVVMSAIVVFHGLDVRLALVALVMLIATPYIVESPVATARSGYGRYSIERQDATLGVFHELFVGRVSHGVQSRSEDLRKLPLAYYHPAGPVGQMLRSYPAGEIAVVGLGVGSIAGYATPERHVTFFELDPLIVDLADNPAYFTYLKNCGANCTVVVGDGRIGLKDAPDGSLSVIILDAFSGDAIPTHLLTVEAFELYRRKLRPDGAVLVNASNMFFDVAEVVVNAGLATGFYDVEQEYWPREAHLHSLFVAAGHWVLLLLQPEMGEQFLEDPRWTRRKNGDPNEAWTDDWQNLFAHYIWR